MDSNQPRWLRSVERDSALKCKGVRTHTFVYSKGQDFSCPLPISESLSPFLLLRVP